MALALQRSGGKKDSYYLCLLAEEKIAPEYFLVLGSSSSKFVKAGE